MCLLGVLIVSILDSISGAISPLDCHRNKELRTDLLLLTVKKPGQNNLNRFKYINPNIFLRIIWDGVKYFETWLLPELSEFKFYAEDAFAQTII